MNNLSNMIKVAVVGGEGIGPEVTAQSHQILNWFAAKRGTPMTLREAQYGVIPYLATGKVLPQDTVEAMDEADAIFWGATGGPETKEVPAAARKAGSLLSLRSKYDLYANLRPIVGNPALADSAPLKAEVLKDVDFVIIRGLTSGIYFGEPRGIETLADGQRRGFNTEQYTTNQVRRVARAAFELARTRQRTQICSRRPLAPPWRPARARPISPNPAQPNFRPSKWAMRCSTPWNRSPARRGSTPDGKAFHQTFGADHHRCRRRFDGRGQGLRRRQDRPRDLSGGGARLSDPVRGRSNRLLQGSRPRLQTDPGRQRRQNPRDHRLFARRHRHRRYHPSDAAQQSRPRRARVDAGRYQERRGDIHNPQGPQGSGHHHAGAVGGLETAGWPQADRVGVVVGRHQSRLGDLLHGNHGTRRQGHLDRHRECRNHAG